MATDDTFIPALLGVAAQAARMFESALELLQEAQASIPAPTLDEVAEMRQGRRPITREAYLLGVFQRALVGAENLASDLGTLDEDLLRNVQEVDLSALELNAIEEAAARRAP